MHRIAVHNVTIEICRAAAMWSCPSCGKFNWPSNLACKWCGWRPAAFQRVDLAVALGARR